MKMICVMMWQIIWLILTVIAETSEQQTGNSGVEESSIIDVKEIELSAYEKGVNEQFPPEIKERRRKLYPVLHQAKKDHRNIKLVRNVLYIDGQKYVPPERHSLQPRSRILASGHLNIAAQLHRPRQIGSEPLATKQPSDSTSRKTRPKTIDRSFKRQR